MAAGFISSVGSAIGNVLGSWAPKTAPPPPPPDVAVTDPNAQAAAQQNAFMQQIAQALGVGVNNIGSGVQDLINQLTGAGGGGAGGAKSKMMDSQTAKYWLGENVAQQNLTQGDKLRMEAQRIIAEKMQGLSKSGLLEQFQGSMRGWEGALRGLKSGAAASGSTMTQGFRDAQGDLFSQKTQMYDQLLRSLTGIDLKGQSRELSFAGREASFDENLRQLAMQNLFLNNILKIDQAAGR